MKRGIWRVALTAPDAEAAEAVMLAFDTALGTVSAFEAMPVGSWRVEGFCQGQPDRAELDTLLALGWAGRDDALPEMSVELLPSKDWVSENQAGFPPIAVGRYFIYGSHFGKKLPSGRVGLLIDAATAFGTGEHATTRGCLRALEYVARRGGRRRVLDMGSGTGVLAIAAAKTWRHRVVARDIDFESVRVAGHNARRNGVGGLVAVRQSDGYRERLLWRKAPYDFIFANILARPLMTMARDLSRALDRDGIVVLSGLLARQEAAVLAAHRLQHIFLRRRIAIDGWHSLILGRGSRTVSPPDSESP